MLKRLVCAGAAALLLAGLACSCAGNGASGAAQEKVTLTLAGPWAESLAVEAVSAEFSKAYPNCRVVYEYVQNYYGALEKRLGGGDAGIDLFITKNIQDDSALKPYALELLGQGDKLDLSGTFDGLVQNFTCFDSSKSAPAQLYAVPLGAEIRGLYVNKTLLAQQGLAVPENRTQLLDACAKLLQAGYVPLGGNPGNFSQWLMYPYICNSIANAPDYDAVYRRVNSREPGVSELFRDPMEFVYTLAAKGYYNYKRMETSYGFYTDSGTERAARSFLNIVQTGDSYSKADDVGVTAFMPGTMSMDNTVSKFRDDYHSGIDYAFLLAPTGNEGGFAYMSPSDGIAVNRASAHADWALRYMDFLFKPANNKLFAEKHHITPNTADAFEQVKSKFSVPQDRISQVGSVTFDYAFYSVILDTLTEISKANNPKYMMEQNGTYVMYPFEYYMEKLEARFQQK